MDSDTEPLKNSGFLLVNNRNTCAGIQSKKASIAPLDSSSRKTSDRKAQSARSARSSTWNSARESARTAQEPIPMSNREGITMVDHAPEGSYNSAVPTIEKHTPWKPPKYQSKSHAQRDYEQRLMRKLGGSAQSRGLSRSLGKLDSIHVPPVEQGDTLVKHAKFNSVKNLAPELSALTNQSSTIMLDIESHTGSY